MHTSLAEVSDKLPSTLFLLGIHIPFTAFAFFICFGWRSLAPLWILLTLAWLFLMVQCIWFGDMTEAMLHECGAVRLIHDTVVCSLPVVGVVAAIFIPSPVDAQRRQTGFDVFRHHRDDERIST